MESTKWDKFFDELGGKHLKLESTSEVQCSVCKTTVSVPKHQLNKKRKSAENSPPSATLTDLTEEEAIPSLEDELNMIVYPVPPVTVEETASSILDKVVIKPEILEEEELSPMLRKLISMDRAHIPKKMKISWKLFEKK